MYVCRNMDNEIMEKFEKYIFYKKSFWLMAPTCTLNLIHFNWEQKVGLGGLVNLDETNASLYDGHNCLLISDDSSELKSVETTG